MSFLEMVDKNRYYCQYFKVELLIHTNTFYRDTQHIEDAVQFIPLTGIGQKWRLFSSV